MKMADFMPNVSLFKTLLFSGTVHCKTETILLEIMNYPGFSVKQIWKDNSYN